MSRSKVFDKRINQSPEVFIRIRDLFTGESIVVESVLGAQGGNNSGAIVQSLSISRQMKSPGRAEFTILNRDRKYIYVPSSSDILAKASSQRLPLLNSSPYFASNGIRYSTFPTDGRTGLVEELFPPAGLKLSPADLSDELWAYDREIDFFKTLFLNDSLWIELNSERAALLQEVYKMKSGQMNPSEMPSHLRRIYEASSIIELRAQVDIDMRDSRGFWFAAFTGFVNNIEDTTTAGQVPTLKIGCQDLMASWAWSMVPTQKAVGPAKAQSSVNRAVQNLISKATGALGVGLNNNFGGLSDTQIVDLLVSTVNSSFTMEGLLDAAGKLPGIATADLQSAQNAPAEESARALLKDTEARVEEATKKLAVENNTTNPTRTPEGKAFAERVLVQATSDLAFAKRQLKQAQASASTKSILAQGSSAYNALQYERASKMILGGTNDYLAGTDPTVSQQSPFSASLPQLGSTGLSNKLTIQTLPDNTFFSSLVKNASDIDPALSARFLASTDPWTADDGTSIIQPLLSVDLEKFWDGPGLYFGTDERIPQHLVRNPKYFRTARPYLRDSFDPASTIVIAESLRTNWNLFFNQVASAQEIISNTLARTFADFYVTGAGWLVYKSPRLNSIPNLQRSPFEDQDPLSLLEYSAGPAGQTPPEMFHGSEYVITGFGQTSRSYNHTTEGRVSKVILPGDVGFVKLGAPISDLLAGTAVSSADLTALLGDRTLTATETMKNLGIDELTQMADTLLGYTNTAPETAQYVYDRLLPWEIGKTLYDPEVDFLYYLTSVSIHYQQGQKVSTTLSCRHGHPRKMLIPVPWILWASVARGSNNPVSSQNFGFVRNHLIYSGKDNSQPVDVFLRKYTTSLYGADLDIALANFANRVSPPPSIVKASNSNFTLVKNRINNSSVLDASRAKTNASGQPAAQPYAGAARPIGVVTYSYIGDGGMPKTWDAPVYAPEPSPAPNTAQPSPTVTATPAVTPTPTPTP